MNLCLRHLWTQEQQAGGRFWTWSFQVCLFAVTLCFIVCYPHGHKMGKQMCSNQRHRFQNHDRTESDLWSLGLSEIVISEDSLALTRRQKSQYKEHIWHNGKTIRRFVFLGSLRLEILFLVSKYDLTYTWFLTMIRNLFWSKVKSDVCPDSSSAQEAAVHLTRLFIRSSYKPIWTLMPYLDRF